MKNFSLFLSLICFSSLGFTSELKTLNKHFNNGVAELKLANLPLSGDLVFHHNQYLANPSQNIKKYQLYIENILSIAESGSYSEKTKVKIQGIYNNISNSLVKLSSPVVEAPLIKVSETATAEMDSITSSSKVMEEPVKFEKKIIDTQTLQSSMWQDTLYYFMAGLFLIALVFFKRASLKGFASKSKVSELTSNNDDSLRFKIQSYDDIQSPMICINDKGLIIWLNKSATKTLSLGKGSSFFLDQEFQKDENNNYCYKNGGNKFRAMIKKVRSASTSGNLITLIPEDTSHYTYFKNVESDIRLDESIEKSLLSNNYLFASAGIPVSVNCEFKTNYTINPSEANIFNKTLKAVYAMAKDLDDSKINISLSDNDDELSVQFDIKNLFENDIDFAQELASQSGKGINLADAWNDVELSLSKRNARVFFFENDEIGGTSFQIQMASREKVFNQPASVIN